MANSVVTATSSEITWCLSNSPTALYLHNNATNSYVGCLGSAIQRAFGAVFSIALPALTAGYVRTFVSATFDPMITNPAPTYLNLPSCVLYMENQQNAPAWVAPTNTPYTPAGGYLPNTANISGFNNVSNQRLNWDISNIMSGYVFDSGGIWANSTRSVAVIIKTTAANGYGCTTRGLDAPPTLTFTYNDSLPTAVKIRTQGVNGGVNSGFGRGGQL